MLAPGQRRLPHFSNSRRALRGSFVRQAFFNACRLLRLANTDSIFRLIRRRAGVSKNNAMHAIDDKPSSANHSQLPRIDMNSVPATVEKFEPARDKSVMPD